ncbi:MAG: hypothetical protein FD151_158 [bacterium]|nr:MAG: hypothetical protein FD151_158 [bacterium]
MKETWDGKTYWLKAKIEADPDEVIKSVDSLRKDHQKTKELEETRGKAETHHHLKTLIESFIYLHWIIKDPDDTRAKLVLAEGIRKKLSIFFKDNPEDPDHEKYLQSYKEPLGSLTNDKTTEWEDFKEKTIQQLAKDSGLERIYSRIYRLACEPAHISDLVDFMPMPEGPITLNQPQTSMLSVIVALNYGIYIFCDILKYGSDFYGLRLDESIGELRTRYDTIRMQKLGKSTAEKHRHKKGLTAIG